MFQHTSSNMSFSSYKIAIVFALLALMISLIILHVLGPSLSPPWNGDWYLGYAFSLAEGHGYRQCLHQVIGDIHCTNYFPYESAYRLPGYPAFLAASIRLFGADIPLAPIRVLQSVISCFIVFVTVSFAIKLGGNRTGIIAGAVVLIDSMIYFYAYLIMSDLLFTFLLLLSIIMLTYARGTPKLIATGFMLAAMLLTRGNFVIGMILIPLAYRPKRNLLILGLATTIFLVPWIVRNEIVMHSFIIFSNGSGDVLWGANNPATFGINPASIPNGSWDFTSTMPGNFNEILLFGRIDPGEVFRDHAKQQLDLAFLTSVPPIRLLWAEVMKVVVLIGMHDPFLQEPEAWITTIPIRVLGLSSAALLIVAVFKRRLVMPELQQLASSQAVRILIVVLVATVLNALMFYGSDRLRLPADPAFALLAAIELSLCIRLLRTPHTGKTSRKNMPPAVIAD